MKDTKKRLSLDFILLLALTAVTFVALFAYLPFALVQALLIVGFVAFLYFGIVVALAKYRHRTPGWVNAAPLWLIVTVPVVVGVSLLFRYWTDATAFTVAFVLGMLFIFLYYWLMVPFALVQKIEEQNWDGTVEEWPDITVLIPAYQERGHIGRTLDSIAASSYPAAVELIVVDDGSLDGTYEEAKAHAGTDAKLIQKENGGKHSALNRGLEEATHDIIVSVDADSWIEPDAFTELVKCFERHPNAGAVAGNVKVGNRGSFITNLQALEYIVGINTFRRAFDHVGLVSVVPGCLGAFRAETLRKVEGYSADTLTEDFDLTIEILRRGEAVHMSEAIVQTYAPTTWRGLYRQRLRWFRGHVQTLRKHVGVFSDPDCGLLQRIVFPYALLSMTLFPLLGLVVSLAIPLAIVRGQGLLMLQIAVFFLLLLILLSLLAIEIDDEDRRLTVYAPLSIVGYKQFLDVVLLKSLVDVLSGRRLGWTRADRIPQDGALSAPIDSPELIGTVDSSETPAGTTEPDTAASGIEVYLDAADEWRWRLKHRNGNIIADSGQGYSSKAGVDEAVDRIRRLAGDADRLGYDPAGFEVYRDADGWHWQLRSRNGTLISRSRSGYATRSDAHGGIDRSKQYAGTDDRWEVTVGESGGYHYRLIAPNGRVIAGNVGPFDSESDAEHAIERVRSVVDEADTLSYEPVGFEVYRDAAGEWRWRLRHRNGRILADSGQGYSSRRSALEGIESVRRNAEHADFRIAS